MASLGAVASIRLIVMLRRIWQSLDKANDISQARLDLERDRMALQYPKWSHAGGKLPSNNKKTDISYVDVDELNKQWKQSHPYEED